MDYRKVYLQAIVKCFSTWAKDITTKILKWNIYLLFAFSIQAKSNWVENVTKIQTVCNSDTNLSEKLWKQLLKRLELRSYK